MLLDEQPTLSPEEDIMRAFKFSLATAVLATVIVGLAMAQPPGGGAGRGMGGMRAAGGMEHERQLFNRANRSVVSFSADTLEH